MHGFSTDADAINWVRLRAIGFRQHLPRRVDLNDIVQDGMVGLLQASRRFEASNGADFKSFVGCRVHGEMFDGLRARDHLTRAHRRMCRREGTEPPEKVSLDAIVDGERRIDSDLLDRLPPILPIEPECEPALDSIDAARWIIEQLPTEWLRRIFTRYYIDGITMKAIAREMGCSEAWISLQHKAALLELRGKLAK